jgi:hypothetical protein
LHCTGIGEFEAGVTGYDLYFNDNAGCHMEIGL